jgi:hypothetical protein
MSDPSGEKATKALVIATDATTEVSADATTEVSADATDATTEVSADATDATKVLADAAEVPDDVAKVPVLDASAGWHFVSTKGLTGIATREPVDTDVGFLFRSMDIERTVVYGKISDPLEKFVKKARIKMGYQDCRVFLEGREATEKTLQMSADELQLVRMNCIIIVEKK